MKKSIIKSIRPQHVANILNGDKTVEISTTAPKDWKDYLDGKTRIKPEPREVFIYCTKGELYLFLNNLDKKYYCVNKSLQAIKASAINGKVVAKFTLNKVEEITPRTVDNFAKDSCLTIQELENYLWSNILFGYAWHIDDLVVFDEPKEISEFRHPHCDNLKNVNVVRNLIHDDYVFQYYDNERCKNCKSYDSDANDCLKSYKPLTRAPQSWCYCLYEEY